MKHVHFIGIGGTGLSAIARLLLESGYTVSGSDRSDTLLGRDLAAAGVQVTIGHAAENIRNADVVLRSSAIPDDNPEVVAAHVAGIPVLKRAAFLGQFMQGHKSIAIAGTHGKTTTTAMISWALSAMAQDPSYIIGGVSKNLGNNAHSGTGDFFVIEADEYDRMFLGLDPDFAVVSTLEHDHPDCFPTPADYRQAFVEFVHRIKPDGHLFVCRDDAGAFSLAGEAQPTRTVWTYGLEPSANYYARNLHTNTRGGFSIEMVYSTRASTIEKVVPISLQVPGEHNVRNALAAMAVCHQAGFEPGKVADTLATFTGVGRRFDVLGESHDITIIDDYAHHPTEIQATLAAARSRYPQRRIIAVWQPHTYTRTISLLDGFQNAFKLADVVFVTEIYSAREANPLITGSILLKKCPLICPFLPRIETASSAILQELRPGDVLLVCSAGDADQISKAVLEGLNN